MKLLTLLFAGLLSASSMQAAYYGNGNYYQPMIQDQLNDTGATSVDYRQHSPIVFQQIKAFAPFLTARDCGGGEAFKMINNVSFVNDVLDLTQDFSVTPQYLYFDTIGHGKVNPTDEDSKKQVYNFANFLQKAAPYLTALEKGDNSGLIATGSASSNVLASELARVGGEKSFSYLNPILFDQDWSKMEYLDSIKLGDGRTINLRSDFSTTGLALFWNTKAWINPTTVANPTVQDLNFARFIEQISCLLLVSKTDAASLNGSLNQDVVTANNNLLTAADANTTPTPTNVAGHIKLGTNWSNNPVGPAFNDGFYVSCCPTKVKQDVCAWKCDSQNAQEIEKHRRQYLIQLGSGELIDSSTWSGQLYWLLQPAKMMKLLGLDGEGARGISHGGFADFENVGGGFAGNYYRTGFSSPDVSAQSNKTSRFTYEYNNHVVVRSSNERVEWNKEDKGAVVTPGCGPCGEDEYAGYDGWIDSDPSENVFDFKGKRNNLFEIVEDSENKVLLKWMRINAQDEMSEDVDQHLIKGCKAPTCAQIGLRNDNKLYAVLSGDAGTARHGFKGNMSIALAELVGDKLKVKSISKKLAGMGTFYEKITAVTVDSANNLYMGFVQQAGSASEYTAKIAKLTVDKDCHGKENYVLSMFYQGSNLPLDSNARMSDLKWVDGQLFYSITGTTSGAANGLYYVVGSSCGTGCLDKKFIPEVANKCNVCHGYNNCGLEKGFQKPLYDRPVFGEDLAQGRYDLFAQHGAYATFAPFDSISSFEGILGGEYIAVSNGIANQSDMGNHVQELTILKTCDLGKCCDPWKITVCGGLAEYKDCRGRGTRLHVDENDLIYVANLNTVQTFKFDPDDCCSDDASAFVTKEAFRKWKAGMDGLDFSKLRATVETNTKDIEMLKEAMGLNNMTHSQSADSSHCDDAHHHHYYADFLGKKVASCEEFKKLESDLNKLKKYVLRSKGKASDSDSNK